MRQFMLQAMPALFVLLWSTGFIGAKYGMPYAEPLTFLATRFGIVFVLLAAIAIATGAPWPRGLQAIVHSIVAGVLIHGIYLGGVFWAIARGMPAGISALIVGVQPLLTAFLSRLVLGESVTRRQWIGTCIGFAGLLLVVGPRIADASGARIDMGTLALNIVALLGITFGTIYQKRFAPLADLRTGNALQYLGAATLMSLGALAFEHGRIEWNMTVILAMAWLVVVLSIGAISLLMLLIRSGGVTSVASLFYLVPPVTALIAYFAFGEQLVPLQWIGMAITALGVWLVGRSPQRQRPA